MKDRSNKTTLLLWCVALLLTAMLLSLFIRNPLLRMLVNSRVEGFNKSYPSALHIEQARFSGMFTVFISGFSLVPPSADTLLSIDTVAVSVNPWKLMLGRLSVSDMEVKGLNLQVVRTDSLTNYDFLLRKKSGGKDDDIRSDTIKQDSGAESSVDYSETAERIFRLVFDKVPDGMSLSRISILSRTDAHVVSVSVDSLELKHNAFSTGILIREDSVGEIWKADGWLNPGNRYLQFRLSSEGGKKLVLPYIGFKWDAYFGFDTLLFNLQAGEGKQGNSSITGKVLVRGLSIHHHRIAADTVDFRKLGMEYSINFLPDAIELDSATHVTFNELDLQPYLRYRPRPSKQITLSLHKRFFPAQQLFSSLPSSLFSNLKDIRVSGELSYNLDFSVDLAMPDSLKFSSSLLRSQFRVVSYGSGNLLKMDSAFEYTAYEKDEPVRTFTVGPSNPDFRRLDQISPFLRFSVMTSEDGGFYQHRGFLEDAFRESIIENIKAGRFVRGGSTISMQLVKNVFLSRNKTVARKLEEALIVWLIENQQICSKDRMFEVYLNIIEWGPLIYGAGEASRFYFAKEPSKLTLAEAIFMASIIPRPKWFKYNFDDDGRLRPSMADYYRLVSAKMLGKGWISQQDLDHLKPEVVLKGPARLMLKNPVDTTIAE